MELATTEELSHLKLNKGQDNKGNLKLFANEALNCLTTYGLRFTLNNNFTSANKSLESRY